MRNSVKVKHKLRNLVKYGENMIFVYDLIEEMCKSRGITVTALCRECNIPRSSLTDYKKGRIKSLSADTLCKIADYFGVTVGYLCGEESIEITDEVLKAAFFGDGFKVSDEMWQELKHYAEFLKTKYF